MAKPTQKQIEDKLEETARTAERVAGSLTPASARKIEEMEQGGLEPAAYGACRFCGQARNVFGCKTECEANEYATRHCNCGEAKEYQAQIEAQEERERVLKNVRANLEELFDGDIRDIKTMSILTTSAELIYDRIIVSASVKLSWTLQVKISRNSKGNISIERKDATAQKVEI